MKRIITLAVAAVALALSACGTDANNEFTRDFNEAQRPLQQLLTQVSTQADDPAKMDKLADGLERTATELRAIAAPQDIKPQFDAYVQQVDASSDVVRALGDAKPKQLADALQDLQQQMSRMVAAEQALKTVVEN